MQYKEYGKTGIKLSRIGFGGMRFENHEDRETSAELVVQAYQKGINYFDTAPYYCEDQSQDIMGLALREMLKTRAEKPFYVSTKTGEKDPDKIRRDLEKSLDRLGLDAIDFYHVWCVMTPEDWASRKAAGVLKQFERLKEEGLIKNICVSTHMSGDDIAPMLDDYPFAGMLVGYSIMNFPFRQKGLEAAAARNMGLSIMNPLGGGIIPQFPDHFNFVKTREDETVVEASLRFLLNDDRITLTLVGFGNTDHLDAACRAIEGCQAIPEKEINRIKEGLNDSFDSLCTGCGYCIDCPISLPIPKLMDAYNHFVLTGDRKAAYDRMKWHWGNTDPQIARGCTDCGQCEDACTQKLDIRKRLKWVEELLEEYAGSEA